MILVIILTVISAICLHRLLVGTFGYWEKRGIPGPKPIPLFGNIKDNILMKKPFGDVFEEIYKKYEGKRYIGFYSARTPTIMLRDPELIKEVLVKNFSSFHDNESMVTEESDPILGRNPFFLTGGKWKRIRSKITTAITTGKIKNMFNLMVSVGENLVKYLEKSPDASNETGLEAKELAAKFTTDVVALCAFGIDGKSFIEEDAEFRRMGRKMMDASVWLNIKIMCMFFFPSLAHILKVKFIATEIGEWFKSIVLSTIKYRKENKIVRHDYLDLLSSLKDNSDEKEFTDLDVVAQAMTFYLDGFETSSVALSFTLFEIANNPEIQKKLREEIDTILSKHNDKIVYEAIQEMTYLDMVLSEGLRKYPPAVALNKVCTQSTSFPGPVEGADPLLVEKGMVVLIPVQGLHKDPAFYPEPEKFDPERFTEENKATRPKHAYLPFGDGPRQCLGFRFAQAQIKAAIVSIVKNFEMKVNPKTKVPIEFDPFNIFIAAKGGLWLNFYKRK